MLLRGLCCLFPNINDNLIRFKKSFFELIIRKKGIIIRFYFVKNKFKIETFNTQLILFLIVQI